MLKDLLVLSDLADLKGYSMSSDSRAQTLKQNAKKNLTMIHL